MKIGVFLRKFEELNCKLNKFSAFRKLEFSAFKLEFY